MPIVPVGEENIAAAGYVHAVAWQASHRGFCTPDFIASHTPQRQTGYLRREAEAGKRIWLLMDPGPVGLVSLWGDLIENLYVLPQEQGRGCGRKLLDFVMARCRSPRLWVLSSNNFAYNWYCRKGFVLTGEEHQLAPDLFEREMVYRPSPCHSV